MSALTMVLTPRRTDDTEPDASSTQLVGATAFATTCVELLGPSAAARATRMTVNAAAADRRPVLIIGEKGLSTINVARAIHERSESAARQVISLDCSAAPPRDSEGALFGCEPHWTPRKVSELEHVSADSLLARSQRDTIVLSHVTELGASAQSKLERILRDGEVTHGQMGDRQPLAVRVIAGVGAELDADLEAGRLRAGLHRRLAGHVIVVPPLRQRPSDVAVIASAVAQELGTARSDGRSLAGFTNMALTLLRACPWRENLSELRSLLRRVTPTGPGGLIQMEDLLAHVRLDAVAPPLEPNRTLRVAKRQFEREYVGAVLRRHGGTDGRRRAGAGHPADEPVSKGQTTRHRHRGHC